MLNVKIDTKEKFHVVTPIETSLSANMTAELTPKMLELADGPVKNIILNMANVSTLEIEAGESLLKTQQQFYENSASFVICELTESAEQQLEEGGLLENMNTTPTESEAWDIVQMEEIERELMDEWGDEEE